MTSIPFDTLKFVETLETAGIDREQAKAISVAVRDPHEVVDVATKRDLEDLRKDMNARIDKLSLQLTVRLGSLLIVALSVMTAIIKL
ncbi:hypothetical protein Rin_00014770 [Candidatus Regiella insecticola 5.15]|uniref:DUF1640 domain-containing protein n=1 Tax=Candidatus Regiella insecticola 5.15 TaxID=1005043 RepID=G2H097_9ENTR|nr:hypothetical protein [Candidatus Regiella insecticola]EGY28590.1 hypothetical protein Rin_00014770 [Candidatus Regiella insecticola 5.15]